MSLASFGVLDQDPNLPYGVSEGQVDGTHFRQSGFPDELSAATACEDFEGPRDDHAFYMACSEFNEKWLADIAAGIDSKSDSELGREFRRRWNEVVGGIGT